MSLQYSDLADFNDFDFDEMMNTIETITVFNGLTVTEGNDQDRTEFFSLSNFDDYMQGY